MLWTSFAIGQNQGAEPSVNDKTILDSDNEVYYDELSGRLVATPNARLQSGQVLLTANRIELDRNQSEAYANGKVILSDGEVRLLANSIKLNFKTGNFVADEVKAGIHPWAFQSKEIRRVDSIIMGIDSSLYYLGKEKYEPNLKFKTIEFDQQNDSIAAKGISVQIGDQWVGRLPSFSGKGRKKPWSYNLRAGKKNNLGWYLGTGGQWALTQSVDLNTDITAYTQRGWLLSPGLEWHIAGKSSDFLGSIESGWINDQGDSLGQDIRGLPVDHHRSYIKAYSINRLDKRWHIAAQVEWNQDSEVFRDFHQNRFPHHQWNDSFGEISYEGRNWTISSLARWQMNKYESAIEQLPSLRFDLAPTPWGNTQIYNALAFEFSAFRERGHLGQLQQKSNKFDLGYEVIRPFHLGHGFIYSPHFAYRRQDYALNGPDASRDWGEWGNEIRYQVTGDYEWNNPIWEINQLRHSMGFSLSHRKVNRLSANKEYLIPILDDPFIDLNLRPIDLMEHIQADGLTPYNVFRIGWENELLTKTEGPPRSLASFNLYQDLHRDEEKGQNKSEELFASLSINPAPWISLIGQSKIDIENGDIIRNSFSTSFHDGTINTLTISYVKYLSFANQWTATGMHRWNESKTIYGSISYEEESNNIPYWQTSIEYKMSPFWTWILSLTGRTGTAKENQTELTLSTSLFAF